jgi:hypothetical protein
MRLRLLLLLVVASICSAVAVVQFSGAVFSTQSTTRVHASADSVTGFLHLYSQSTDPDGLTGYAIRRLSNPPVPAATGSDLTLVADMGGFPDRNKKYAFPCTFTLKAPPVLPYGATQITVTVAFFPDPATGEQPLQDVNLAPLGNNGGGATITLTAGQKVQCNVTVGAHKRFQLGVTYVADIRLTVTYTGGPAGYYVYDIPCVMTDAGA